MNAAVLLFCCLAAGTAAAQTTVKPDYPEPKGIKPKAVRDGEAEKAHETSKSTTSGGALDPTTKFYHEGATNAAIEGYDANFKNSKEERKARWRKFWHPKEFVPNTPQERRAKAKHDSKAVIKNQGELDPKERGDITPHSRFQGELDPKPTGDITPSTRFEGDREPKPTGDITPSTRFEGDMKPKPTGDITPYTRWEGDVAPKPIGDITPYTRFEGNLKPKKEPDHEAYTQYQGEIRMYRSGLRTKKPFYQRKVRNKPHYDHGTEKGLWND